MATDALVLASSGVGQHCDYQKIAHQRRLSTFLVTSIPLDATLRPEPQESHWKILRAFCEFEEIMGVRQLRLQRFFLSNEQGMAPPKTFGNQFTVSIPCLLSGNVSASGEVSMSKTQGWGLIAIENAPVLRRPV